jgi:23S rRNA (guanosine2251-2'-O)-methyltransferase
VSRPQITRRRDADLIFGVHSVLEKLNARPEDVSEVLISATIHAQMAERIEEAARLRGCPVSQIDAATLDALTRCARHQGVAARVVPFKYGSFASLLAALQDRRACCVVFLDGVTDPRNFGSILRTAEAMGIGDVVIAKDRAVGVTPTVVKASAGAVHYVRICRVSNLARSLITLRDRGVWIIGLDPRGDKLLHEMKLPERLAVVLGAEGSGIRPLVRSKCDYLAALPMQGKVGSLNVSVAWGMFAYELMRQQSRDMC